MWKRDDAASAQPPAAGQAVRPQESQAKGSDRQESSKVNIGKSVIIKGELSGSEDLTIEGQVDGKIELRQNVLTIGPNGRIKAQINAKAVIVQGEVVGNITATEKVDIRDAGSVDGDLAAPRIAIADGAHFRGSIDMKPGAAAAQSGAQGQTSQAQASQSSMPGAQTTQAKPAETKPAETKPATPGAPAAGQPQQTTLPNPTTGQR